MCLEFIISFRTLVEAEAVDKKHKEAGKSNKLDGGIETQAGLQGRGQTQGGHNLISNPVADVYATSLITLIFWNFSSYSMQIHPCQLPPPPTFLSLLHWRKEDEHEDKDKLKQQLFISKRSALKATHFCTALHSKLATFTCRIPCIQHLASGISCVTLKGFIISVAFRSFPGSNFPVWCPSVHKG